MAQTQFASSSKSEGIALGQATHVGVSTCVFQIDAAPTWTGSFQPVKKVAGSSTWRNVYYLNHLNNTTQTAAITGSGVFSMDITGCDAAISHSLSTSGSVVFNYSIVRN
jgi:hypothetical protein